MFCIVGECDEMSPLDEFSSISLVLFEYNYGFYKSGIILVEINVNISMLNKRDY